ncbi:MAG: anhydro-N-acetylmuramic acid kinase [Bacteroidota bacterium]|nr:anhydro-N-acetylmuramic acid kinase [Bacteroidota bacterium]
MLYKVIGVMSGSSLDGLDVVFTELQEAGGVWTFEIKAADCVPYNKLWEHKLQNAVNLSAKDYLLLHSDYGRYIAQSINEFIDRNNLHHQVNLISSHGHTTFHLPKNKMTHQLGDGSAIAADTHLSVVSDLRALDVAFGGEGAPIVPLGEKLLFGDYDYFLNIGGIANVSIKLENEVFAFDVCAANRVLNLLANEKGLDYDDGGEISSKGIVNQPLLEQLNELEYYKQRPPKSLANSFGTDFIYPFIKSFGLSVEDNLRTYTEHICIQIKNCLQLYKKDSFQKLFITGGGVFNNFLITRLAENLEEINFEIVIPGEEVVKYKEALIMALLGVLRWREQFTVLASVTGASQNSIGGALWLGTEA